MHIENARHVTPVDLVVLATCAPDFMPETNSIAVQMMGAGVIDLRRTHDQNINLYIVGGGRAYDFYVDPLNTDTKTEADAHFDGLDRDPTFQAESYAGRDWRGIYRRIPRNVTLMRVERNERPPAKPRVPRAVARFVEPPIPLDQELIEAVTTLCYVRNSWPTLPQKRRAIDDEYQIGIFLERSSTNYGDTARNMAGLVAGKEKTVGAIGLSWASGRLFSTLRRYLPQSRILVQTHDTRFAGQVVPISADNWWHEVVGVDGERDTERVARTWSEVVRHDRYSQDKPDGRPGDIFHTADQAYALHYIRTRVGVEVGQTL